MSRADSASASSFFGPLLYLADAANYTVRLAVRGFVDATSRSACRPLF